MGSMTLCEVLESVLWFWCGDVLMGIVEHSEFSYKLEDALCYISALEEASYCDWLNMRCIARQMRLSEGMLRGTLRG